MTTDALFFDDIKEITTEKLYQYDIGQKLKISGFDINENTEVHFKSPYSKIAKIATGTLNGSSLTVVIPDEFLESAGNGKVWVCSIDENEVTTIRTINIPIVERAKPDGYVSKADGSYRKFNEEIADLNNNKANKEEVSAEISKAKSEAITKADSMLDDYDKTQVQPALEVKADKATTLAGYGITDAYDKTYLNKALDSTNAAIEKAKSETDSKLNEINADVNGLKSDLDEYIKSGVEVRDKSVTPNKTTFFELNEEHYNLFNKEVATKGKATNCLTGEKDAGPVTYLSAFMAVEPGKSYYVGVANGTNGQYLEDKDSWSFHDKDGNLIPHTPAGGTCEWNPIPVGVAYMRVDVLYKDSVDSLMVVEGTEAPTKYVSYADGTSFTGGWKDENLRKFVNEDAKEFIEKNIHINAESSIGDGTIELKKLDGYKKYCLNISNPDDFVEGLAFNGKGGITKNPYSKLSGFIPVKENTKYWATNTCTICTYDKDKNFLRCINHGFTHLFKGFSTESGECLIRYSCGLEGNNGINEYNYSSNYVDFNTNIIFDNTVVQDSDKKPLATQSRWNLYDSNWMFSGNINDSGVISFAGAGGNFSGGFLKCKPGKTYSLYTHGGANTRKAYEYDKNFNFLRLITIEKGTDGYISYYTPSPDCEISLIEATFFAESNPVRDEYIKNARDKYSLSQYFYDDFEAYNKKELLKSIVNGNRDVFIQEEMQSRGLTWNCLGDSLTTLSWGHNMYNIVADILGLNPVNYGIVSSTIADYKNDGTTQNPMCIRYADMGEADIVTVMGCTNDTYSKIGTMEDREVTTLYGACHVLFRGLIEKYPEARIGVILPPQNGQGITSYVETQGGDAGMAKMMAKVNVVKEVAEYYSIPTCDLFHRGGISGMIESNIGRLLQGDYLHITIEGYKVLSHELLSFMKALLN